MRKPFRLLAVSAAALVAAAVPVAAGTVYVSVPLVDDAAFDSTVAVVNNGAGAQQISAVFLESGSNGAAARPAGTTRNLPGRSTVLLDPAIPAGKTGLLEITGSPDVTVTGRVTFGGQSGLGFALPVLSTDNTAAANGSMVVQGLFRNGDRRTTFVLVNLGHALTTCNVTPYHSDGTPIANAATVTVPPVAQNVYVDALSAWGVASVADANVSVTCNQRFYAYAVVNDTSPARAALILPAIELDPDLAPPGSGCPAGATCLVLPGNFYTPTEAEPMRIYKLLVPSGRQFRRLEATFKFRHGGWHADPASIFTLIYMNRNGKFRSNTYGVVDIAAGAARRVHVELTADLPNAPPPTGVQNERQKVLLIPSETYDVKYVYDAEHDTFRLQMTDSQGNSVVDLSAPLKATTNAVVSKGSFWVQFSEPFTDSIHRPSLGWTHSDLVFALIP